MDDPGFMFVLFVLSIVGHFAAIALVAASEEANAKTYAQLHPRHFVENPLQDRPGYVYLIRDIDISGHCKIGRTMKPEQRFDLFTVKLPFRYEVLALIESQDCVALEADLQEYFYHRHARGEWFALTQNEIEAICSLTQRSAASSARMPVA